MKFNKKEIMEIAMTNIKRDTYNPYTAILMAFETWLKKNKLKIVKEQDEGLGEA